MASKYEYSSYASSASKNGSTDGNRLFAQADTNDDGVIDSTEFANFIGSSDSGNRRASGGYGSASYERLSYSTGVARTDASRRDDYQSSSYESASGFDASALKQAASYTADSNTAWSRYGAEVRGVGLYFDPNPEVIRRVAPDGTTTYTQNVQLRLLQPPPVPAAGPLIIKEVRPPSLPALPPLRIKQQELSIEQLPPLILREKPPQPPAPISSETIVRTLPALPPGPRSVIIERYPAAPPRPRDIIIERWLPYPTVADRKTIIQRDETVIEQSKAHNVIIQYETAEVRVVRKFQNLGVTQENPQAYLARYGAQLVDTETLLQQARAAGVVEDLSAAMAAAASGISSLSLSSGAFRTVGVSGENAGEVSSTYSTSTYQGSSGGSASDLVDAGFKSGFVRTSDLAARGSSAFSSSNYKSSSYSSGGGTTSDAVSTGFSNTEAKL